MFICLHSFSVSGKKTPEKSEAKNLCVEVHWGGDGGGGGGGGVGGTPTKNRMITDIYFLDLEHSEFRVDSSKHNTELLPIS